MEQKSLIPLSEVKEMATHATKSGLFGLPSAEAALSLMLLCQADGMHPMQAVRKYHIIKGRPSMRAEAMLAEFQANGGKIQWIERSDTKCSAQFSHPSGGELVVEWSIKRAEQAGLLGKDNWKQYPCQMLAARVISEGVRALFPAVVCGVYTPEEIQDFGSKPSEPIPAEPIPTKVETIKAEEAKVIEPNEIIEPISKVDTGTGTICGEQPILAETAEIIKPEKTIWHWCENMQCVDPVPVDGNKTINTSVCPNCHQVSLHEAKINTRKGAADERLKYIQNKNKSFQPKATEPAKPAQTESLFAQSAEPQKTSVATAEPSETKKDAPISRFKTAKALAEKIKETRKHLISLGYKTLQQFEEVTEKVIGRRCSNLSSLSFDELDKLSMIGVTPNGK